MSASENFPRVTTSQVFCACVDGFGAFSMAVLVGFTSTALVLMQNDPGIEITDEEGSWIGASVPGMALLGSLSAGKLLEVIGRRKVCMMTSLVSVVAWAFVALSGYPFQIIAARVLGGFCLGIQQVAVSIYVSETVHPKLKPMLSIIPGVTAMTGFLLINISGGPIGWRGMAWLGALLSLPLFIHILRLPDTPYFLFKSGKEKECLDTLKWLWTIEADALRAFEDLQKGASAKSKETKSNFHEMMNPPYRWPLCVAILLHICQQMTGISAISAFMGLICERAGSPLDTKASLLMTVVNFGAIFVVGKALSKYPKRTFIRASSKIMVGSLFILAVCLWMREGKSALEGSHLSYIPILTIILYTFGFSVGWGPLPWMFIGDGLPVKIRDSAAGVVIATNWVFNFLTTKTFNWLTVILGSYSVFALYGVLTFLSMNIMDKYLPETCGLSDLQLEDYYKESYKPKFD